MDIKEEISFKWKEKCFNTWVSEESGIWTPDDLGKVSLNIDVAESSEASDSQSSQASPDKEVERSSVKVNCNETLHGEGEELNAIGFSKSKGEFALNARPIKCLTKKKRRCKGKWKVGPTV